MKLKMYSVFDAATQAFLPPFYCRTKSEAIRSFSEAARDQNKFGRHMQDYALFEVAVFDDASGLIEPHKAVERVISAVECQEVDPPPNFGR